MATHIESINLSASEPKQQVRSNNFNILRFDYLNSLFIAWLIIGQYIDGWAHLHILDLETFFTPWHAIAYSGLMLLTGVLVITALYNHRKGLAWKDSVPKGYGLSLVGVAAFVVSAAADMVGHTIFGVEVSVEGLLSPSHLGLAVAGVMLVCGPFRSAWRRGERGWGNLLPMLISLTMLYSVITFFTQFGHPVLNAWSITRPSSNLWLHHALGVISIVFQSMILVSFLFLLVRRWTLPRGAFLFIIGINATMMAMTMEYTALALAGVLTGIIVELLWWWLRPTFDKPAIMRLFFGAVPFIYYILYFAALQLTIGVKWSGYLWTGSIVMASVAAYLLTFIMIPPAIPQTIEATD